MRRCCLRKRYGRFKLPTIRGATTSKARRKDVNWLARTDPRAKEVEFSEHFGKLSPDGQRYIVAHEEAHLKTGPDHNAAFYAELKRLVRARRIPWEVAYELESYNCHQSH